jgi:hypothetical protein
MTSAIDSIYSAIAAWTPTFDSDLNVQVRGPSALSEVFNPLDCPTRMLSPLAAGSRATTAHIALGKTVGMTWFIVDTLYMKPAAEGDTLKENGQAINTYIASYADTVRTHRAPTTQSAIKNVGFQAGVEQWPGGGDGVNYIIVKATLEVFETF